MHALKTFSQLVTFEPKSDEYKVYHTPIMIADTPRMAYRGVLVDVARHFMPIKFLEKVIDVMSAAKLNVLHLHLSDQESYPLESKTFPDLCAHARARRAASSRVRGRLRRRAGRRTTRPARRRRARRRRRRPRRED